jgi:hypothetical protein
MDISFYGRTSHIDGRVGRGSVRFAALRRIANVPVRFGVDHLSHSPPLEWKLRLLR